MKKMLSGLIALVAAILIACGTAFGATSDTRHDESSDVAALGKQSAVLSKASKKVKIKVVTRIGNNKLSYTSNGLIKRYVTDSEISSYKYEGKKAKSFSKKSKYFSTTTTGTVSYEKAGRISEISYKEQNTNKTYHAHYYYNGKGRISKIVCTGDSSQADTRLYYYDKKKRVSKIVSGDLTSKFTYDKRGYCNSSSFGPTSGYGFSRYFEMKNVYKNGRIVKVGSRTSGTGSSAYFWNKVKYKTIKVPKSYVSKIKQQQKALFNPNPKVIL